MSRISPETDVLVVGGGPAGLAAAIAAQAKGFRVMVVDCARPPIDKACGEGLMPEALDALARLGVTIPADVGLRFRGIRFLGAGACVEADFPGGWGIALPRTQLHQLLIDRAAACGVSLLWGTRVTGISAQGVTVDGHPVRSRWLVGADGQNSPLRRWAGLDRARQQSLRFGRRRHYQLAPWTDRTEIYWGVGCQIYATPIGAEEVCAVLLSRDSHIRFDHALEQFPQLARRLAGAVPISAERGAVTATRSLRRVFRDRVVLIGDASGSVDAVTGEGLCLSFQQADILAEALVSGHLEAYQSAHTRLARRPALMARLMLVLDRFPRLRPRILRALAAEPAIFANLLAMNAGSLTQREFVVRGMLPLGRQMLTDF